MPGVTLCHVAIHTGRTHQIRVHLAHLGHPILGDDKYGDFELNHALRKLGLRRMFLHAASLAFSHPVTGEALVLRSPLPRDLAGAEDQELVDFPRRQMHAGSYASEDAIK